ncbi:hypothetical protein E1293_14570 [Actinomadura darangshiensis]|uniref:Uncharacterized protein n=1 Tax=Actinomadura darangshiensis TaxID=705336 RepID=A0A4R5BF45_9ACTN|nr:hypothetical protein E1293_14570 [Actinomadura darangshiensis]
MNTISPGVISTPMGAQELHGPMGTYILLVDGGAIAAQQWSRP